jgi:serine/threonine protein kinase/tetratricopeptide (TPR) repeat protein
MVRQVLRGGPKEAALRGGAPLDSAADRVDYPAAAMRVGDVVEDRFVIERPIRRGGMGAVYLARDQVTASPVALKLIDRGIDDTADRFRREARVLADLCHPSIVRYVTHGQTDASEPFLVMEWLEGEDLAQRLARGGLTVLQAVSLVRRTAQALAFAHAKGVVHRDIKPSNLFLVGGDPDRVKILDFGIALPQIRSQVLTRTGSLLGTVGYMAPEQARGSSDVDAPADVFSLGCVFFECLTGRPAFAGSHAVAVLAKVLSEEIPRVCDLRPELSPALDDLVARLLSKDVTGRPRDGAAVAAEIDRLDPLTLEGTPTTSSRPASLSRTERRVVSIVLAENLPQVSNHDPTLPSAETDREGTIRDLAARFGATVSPLREGGLVFVFFGGDTAMDQAGQAASCALALKALRPEVRGGVATCRTEISNRLPVGLAIDRAASVMRALGRDGSEGRIAVDEVTVGLLGPRYELCEQGRLRLLVGERDDLERRRLLLGRPTPCVGREGELAHLEATLAACIDDSEPRAVLVTAHPGTGKSRLASELLTRVRARQDVRVLAARADAVAAGASLALAKRLLRSAAGIRESDPTPKQREQLRDYLARKAPGPNPLLAELVDALGEIMGGTTERGSKTRIRVINDRTVTREGQAFQAWLDLETKSPLLIVLEDLHWGDVPTIAYIEEALRGLRDRPLMVLALARPSVHEQFPDLWGGVGGDLALHEIRLGPLTRRAAERLARSVLGAGVRPETVAEIVAQSDGNAFYLEELIRWVAEGKTDLPETMLAMAETRLTGVEPEARRILRAASVFGEAFWSGGVAALIGDATGTSDWLESLADRELLVRMREPRFPGEHEYAFRHALLRDAAYQMLTEADRPVAHHLAAQWLETVGEKSSSVLARHYQEAGDHRAAAVYHMRAGDVATRLCSYDEARTHYNAAWAALVQLPEDDAIRRRKVDTLLQQIFITLVADTADANFQRAAEARELLDEIAQSGELSPQDQLRLARVNYFTGRIHFYRAETHKAMEHYRRVLPAARESGDDELVGLPSALIGTATLVQGNALEAEPLLAQSIGPMERLGEPFEWFRAVGYHGMSLVLLGRYREGVQELARIVGRAREVQKPNLLSASCLMAGTTHLLAGDWPQTLAYLEEVRVHATVTGDKLHLSLAWSGIGWASSQLGRHDEARAARATARTIASAMGGKLVLDDWYRAADAEIALNAGDVDEALQLATAVVDASAPAGLLLSHGIAERVRSDVLALRGDRDGADASMRESIMVLERGGLHAPATRSRLAWALQRRAQGDAAAAERLHLEAIHQLEAFGCEYAHCEALRRWKARDD